MKSLEESLHATRTQEMLHATRAYEMPSCAAWTQAPRRHTEDYYENKKKNKPEYKHPIWFHQHSTIVGEFSKS